MRVEELLQRSLLSAGRREGESAGPGVVETARTARRTVGQSKYRTLLDGEWARPVVATVLILLLLGVPHHRLFIWLNDSSIVKYWKEIAFVLGCLAYVFVLVRRRELTRTEQRGALWAAPFVIAVLVRVFVGIVRGEDSRLLFVGGGSQLYYVGVFLLTIYLLETSRRDTCRQVEHALRWVLVATTLAAVLSILDNLFHISGHFDFFARTRVEARLDYDPRVWRSSATYQSPMVLGMVAGSGLLLSLFFISTRLGRRPRAWAQLGAFGSLAAIHLLGLYLTFSRGPLVASATGAAIIGLFGTRGLVWRDIAASWRKIAAGIVTALLTLTLLIALLPPPLQRHLGSIFDWNQDQNNLTRLGRISWGLEQVREAPWIGHGLGSAQTRLANHRIQELGESFFFTNPESQLLSFAMEGGILLLLPALLVAGFMMHTAIVMASHQERPAVQRLGVLFIGLQAALYAESLIMPILDTRTFQIGFWVLFGVLVHFRQELEKSAVHVANSGSGMGPRVRRDTP